MQDALQQNGMKENGLNALASFLIFLLFAAMLLVLAGFSVCLAETAGNTVPGRGYFALLIGQSYEENSGLADLAGCPADALAVNAMLEQMTLTPFRTSRYTDLTAQEIREAIATVYRGATDHDICLFYYAGHGFASNNPAMRGAIVGTDGVLVTLDELLDLLDEWPGDKVIILDSCYSGGLLSIIKRYEAESGRGGHYVLCAAGSDERTQNIMDYTSGCSFGIFTESVLRACGSYGLDSGARQFPGDRNGDGAFTLSEVYYYAKAYMLKYTTAQHIQIYPRSSDFCLWACGR